MRWYGLPPVDTWTNEYFMPVGDVFDGSASTIAAWFFNPNHTAPITVDWEIGQ